MAFHDLTPARRGTGTGVRISRSERCGVILALSDDALAHIVLKAGDRVRVQHDPDPAMPRLRISLDDAGVFHATKPPGNRKGSVVRTLLIRLGHIPALDGDAAKGLDCLWEQHGAATIDIDLPREFRAVTTTPIAAGHGRTANVTLPGRTPVERVKERV